KSPRDWLGGPARGRSRSAVRRSARCKTGIELGARRPTLPGADRSGEPGPRSVPHGCICGGDYKEFTNEPVMSAAFTDARPAPLAWLGWMRRELAPSHERKVRTLILVCGAVLCVIISMSLQVPEVAISAYMVFFISKENKTVTTIVGVLGLIGITIAIA